MKSILSFVVFLLLINTVSYSQSGNSQESASVQDSSYEYLLNVLEGNDIGFIWNGALSQDNRLGFIGSEFQRIQIHFVSIIKNIDNPYEYLLYGKSRVKNTICEFQGSLLVSEAGILEDRTHPELMRAYLKGDYVLFEDQSCMHSGIFRGNFISSVYLDTLGTVYYDDLQAENKDFVNNEFFGLWENYDSQESKDCNWGDFRIPYSGELDMGDKEFVPSYQFLENGWKDYLDEKKLKEKQDTIPEWWN